MINGIIGTKDPIDTASGAKVILLGVEIMMHRADLNFIISGCKSPESESQNFDPSKVANRFIDLMDKLPINAAAFSPYKEDIACYVVIKRSDKSIYIKKAHEDPRYQDYIGHFKKPDIGMFVVIKDIAYEEFGQVINKDNSIMIGNTWHDKQAAQDFGIPFIHAKFVTKLASAQG